MKLEGKTTKSLELRGQINPKRGYPDGFTSGLTPTNDYRKKMDRKANHTKVAAVFLLAMLVLCAIAVLTFQSSNVSAIKIDGRFEDWQGVEKTTKARDARLPANIDIAEYATAETGKNVAFYAKVYGNLLAGDERYIVEAPAENPVYVANQRETAIPNANGRDVAYVFIDTDNDPATGFKPSANFAVGADKAIEVIGKNGKIEASRVLVFAGVVQQEWTWNIGESVAAAVSCKELETMAGKSLLGIDERYSVYFYIIDWRGKASLSDLSIVRTTYHTIIVDGNMSDWHADEFISTRNSCNLSLTWDEYNLYIGWTNTDWDGWGDFFAYFDTLSGGTQTSYSWYGIHTLPGGAIWDYLLCAEGSSYYDLKRFTGGSWQTVSNNTTTYWGWSGNTNTEIKIPFNDLGITGSTSATLNILIFAQWEDAINVWNAFPKENPAPNSGPVTFTHYYTISELVSGFSPNLIKTWSPKISIDGNAALAAKASEWGWQGDGSAINPYIIKNYYIDSKGGTYGIWIQNTDVYLVVRNCFVWNATSSSSSPSGSAIAFSNVQNGKIENNICKISKRGIYLTSSSNNILSNNTAIQNEEYGIYLYNLSTNNYHNNTIASNNLSANGKYGIYFYRSSNNTIINNTLLTNAEYGINIYQSSNNTIFNNNISSNSQYGLCLNSSSKNNLVTYNWFVENLNYAINITASSGTGNIIHHNKFIRNNGAGKGVSGNCQAYDNGNANSWHDNSVQEGNYWSNWDGNGWGTSSAYPIAGGAGASDWYPLGSPVSEFSLLSALALVAAGFLGASMVLRRKQE
ncbi:MAG: right-handed parallel beta-helix repeat-containing protein [Thermoplasmata archaeon]|nr:right-handed parallel beta-helix repeat-containing protein [Thermoplasmata archaeon]